jgi:hypothetical protein
MVSLLDETQGRIDPRAGNFPAAPDLAAHSPQLEQTM